MRVDHPDAAKANEQALHDLNNGANMLVIPFAGGASARGYGLAADKATLANALDEVMLDLISIRLEGAGQDAFVEYVEEKGLNAGSLCLSFGFDPIGNFASTGGVATEWAAELAAKIKDLKAKGLQRSIHHC